MSFFKKLFVRSPEDHMSKGEALYADDNFYEARLAYEKGVECCQGKPEYAVLLHDFAVRIEAANRSLAELNIAEAEHALTRGAVEKAVEHLELAKTLTQDANIREKADLLLVELIEKTNDPDVLATPASCNSCSQVSAAPRASEIEVDTDLDPHVHYDLLIHQLPEEMQGRYSGLGEEFAYMFIAASQDRHAEAIELLEKWFRGSDRDIYCYEKGKILHRLGRILESEACLQEAIKANGHNPLPHLGLALLYIEGNRLVDAARQIDAMISADIFTGQALMMRAEVFELAGDVENAIGQYGALLETPLARAAAEKLHPLLIACNRQPEAAHIFKRYLGKCGGH